MHAVCGSRELTTPIRDAIVTWGLNGSPFDCWLAERGMNTLELRVARAGGIVLQATDRDDGDAGHGEHGEEREHGSRREIRRAQPGHHPR